MPFFKRYDYETHTYEWDFFLIGLAAFLITVLALSGYGLKIAVDQGQQSRLQLKTYKEACIDAGGYPVEALGYIKGHGDGYLCINPSAIIEMKDK